MDTPELKRSSKKTRLWLSARRKKTGAYRRVKKNSYPNIIKRNSDPKSLVTLCERAIKKYKLIPDTTPKKLFTPPETFSVVGGKPLRKRSEGQYNYNYKVPKIKKERKRSNPKSLVELCQIVIQEYNLLPQTEELLISQSTPLRKRSRSQFDVAKKRPRGRARKSAKQDQNDTSIAIQIKRPRGRPPKDPSAASYVVEYSSTQLTSFAEQPISNVRIKEELDLAPVIDPLRHEDVFTVVIKEEDQDNEDDEITFEVSEAPVVPIHQATPQALVINPEAYLQVPGPSRIGITQAPKLITVVMDEYQIFANSIAEQLRALPVNRALLLQLDIQSMIDNEKQLISHEH